MQHKTLLALTLAVICQIASSQIPALRHQSAARSSPKKDCHVADADREYATVFSHVENPYAKEMATLSYEQCIGKEVEFTENHMNAFLVAVRGIVADEGSAGKVKELDAE
jgi:hypothetical protein